MLHKLDIQNFQSHENTTLEFSKGVNVIVGTSDSGKTAIIRALRWLVWNRPSGDDFRSSWGGDTYVHAILQYGETFNTFVSRYKGDKGNTYDLHGAPFVGFGTTVPDEIQEVLGMNEINLQQQLDSPFLLSETPGNVAQYFNKIANLDKIDSTQSRINSAIRKINSDIQYYDEQIHKYEQKLKEFPDLAAIQKRLDRLERKDTRLADLNSGVRKVNHILNKIDSIDNEIDDLDGFVKCESIVNSVLSKLNEKQQLSRDITELKRKLYRASQIDADTGKLAKIVSAEDHVVTLLQKYTVVNKLVVDTRKLDIVVGRVSTLDKTLLKTQENASKLKETFESNFPETCPLCNTPKSKLKL
jgi:DNA repair protein SbcC/Rad50